MKVVIFAGGFGTRLSEETHLIPKPMIEIGGKPILWHIMKWYSKYGYSDFIICAGYKQEVIKRWFADYYLSHSDVTFSFREDGEKVIVHNRDYEPWDVTVVNTGLETMTGGRLWKIKDYVGDEPFMLTYGDGIADVDLDKLLSFHKKMGRIVTLTSVMIEQNKGVLDIQDDVVCTFMEKQNLNETRINGGFMVVEPEVYSYIYKRDDSIFERGPMEQLAKDGQLAAYRHDGFWQCIDTKRELEKVNGLIKEGSAPWIYWKE